VCCGGGGIISSVNYNSNANSIAYGKIAIALISLILLGSGVFLIVYSLRKKMEYPITVIIYQLYITMNAGTSQKITSLDWDDIEKIFDRLYMIIYKNQEKLQPLKVVFNNNNYGQICSSFGNSTMNPRFSNRNI
jgi:hypothetical protein